MLLSDTDYLLQGIIFLLVFVHPWFLRLGQGIRAFGYPLIAIFVWGLWRMFYFDPATKNDVPGIGYFVSAFFYALIAWGCFGIRALALRKKKSSS